jgi:RNA polymerase sigma-70 factor (ECF subfamily)
MKKVLSRSQFRKLLQEARNGYPNALGFLLTAFWRRLFHEGRQRLSRALQGKLDAFDLAQNTLEDAWKDFNRFHGHTEPELVAWLRGILRHNLQDTLRYLHRSKRDIAREVPLTHLEGARDLTPEELASQKEMLAALQQALANMRSRDRQVLIWHFMEDLTHTEIAAKLGRSSEAVRKIIERKIKHLAQRLKDFN